MPFFHELWKWVVIAPTWEGHSQALHRGQLQALGFSSLQKLEPKQIILWISKSPELCYGSGNGLRHFQEQQDAKCLHLLCQLTECFLVGVLQEGHQEGLLRRRNLLERWSTPRIDRSDSMARSLKRGLSSPGMKVFPYLLWMGTHKSLQPGSLFPGSWQGSEWPIPPFMLTHFGLRDHGTQKSVV